MYGYACWETVELLPAPVVLANRITSLLTTCREENLISGIGPDGKAQVSVQYAFGVPERVDTIVISCQHDADKDPTELREELRRLVIARACHDVRIDEQTKIFINPSGRFVLGGFEADTGLTGRKLMVDTYGGLVPHGGGALSGKDGTKVDRSGAYMAPGMVSRELPKQKTPEVKTDIPEKSEVEMQYMTPQVFAKQHAEHRRSHRAGLILIRQVDQGQGGVGRQKESALACLRLHRQKQFVVLGLCDLI